MTAATGDGEMSAGVATRPRSRSVGRLSWSPGLALVVVCIVHAVLPLVFAGIHLYLGSDETVYSSQFNAHVPAGVFTAPRARGVPYLVAPVTLLTTSVAALRVYLSVLSGIGLYLGLLPWLRLRPGWTAPLAGTLFASLWVATYYGFAAMPNEWDAYAALAAVGLLLLYRERRRPATLGWLVVALAVMGLLRPQDSVWLGVPLLVCAAVVPRLQGTERLRLAGAVVTGLVAGWAEWVIEAYTSYGGLIARIHAGEAENGGGGVHFALAAQARALAGPLLCRGSCQADAPIVTRLWWVALLVLVAVAVAAALRSRDSAWCLVPVACGAIMVIEYTVSVTYAAPRFLLPAYALLAVPCAQGVIWLAGRRRRRAIVAGLTIVFVAHLAVQLTIIRRDIVPRSNADSHSALADAAALRRAGVAPDCSIRGGKGQLIAYALRCGNQPVGEAAVRREISAGVRVVWLSPKRPGRSKYWSRWQTIRVPGRFGPHPGYASLSPVP